MRIRLVSSTANRRPTRKWAWARTSDWPGIATAVAVPTVLVAGLLAPLHGVAATHHRSLAAEHQQPVRQALVHDFVTTSAAPPTRLTSVRRKATRAHAAKAEPARHEVQVSSLASDGIPRTALDAYLHAAKQADTTHPGCALPWPLLAGIGRVESDHGRFAGAVLYADGTSSTKIIGIRLDGTRSAVIRDTDNGRLDGDTEYDRAVGPMQFIPSTWMSYGADGNGDGHSDPFNIFDAALAAANYLCVAGGNLATLAGQVRAVLAYNHSSAYLDEVLALEKAYASGAGVIVPVGPNPPRLPAHPRTKLPPVNPGPPPQQPKHHKPAPKAHPAPSPTASSPSGASPSPAPSATPSSSPPASSTCPTPSPTPSSSGSSTGSGTDSGTASSSPSSSASSSASPSGTSASTSPTPSPTHDC